MKSIGIVFLGLLSLFGCTAKVRPSEHFPTIPPIAVPQARTSSSGAVTTDAQGNTQPVVAAEIDPDCPYLTVEVLGNLCTGGLAVAVGRKWIVTDPGLRFPPHPGWAFEGSFVAVADHKAYVSCGGSSR